MTLGIDFINVYVRIARTSVVSAAFSSYVLALAKNLYKKGARKTLMKLTAGEDHEMKISIFLLTQ